MINHSARELALVALLMSISSSAEGADPPVVVEVVWEKDPVAGSFIDPATMARVYLSTIGSVQYAQHSTDSIWDDDIPYDPEDDEDPGSFGDEITRSITWTVRVRAEALDATSDFQALAWCEKMRTRLARRSSLAALNTIGCALQTCRESRDLTAVARVVDVRHANTAAFDLVLNTSDTDADPERYPDIRSMVVTPNVDDVDGAAGVIDFYEEP